MRIGIAIPCFNKHISQLLTLLKTIEAQTRLPDAVSISCSSTKAIEFPELKGYSFPIQLSLFEGRKNTAENRNLAFKRFADMDAISFFDADDLMHPQRLEFIELALNKGADIVLHNYTLNEVKQFELYETANIIYDQLAKAPSGCAILKIQTDAPIHHSQVTVRRPVLNRVQFNEERSYERREDSIFCGQVLSLPDIRNAYISEQLSYYKESHSLVAV
uniref:Glycosyltransferase 2-like domain-containing protein n=1 Tax=viral metagenome TaxID=1070528 RepID=A0A6C0JZ84_9ZZZZ